MMPSLILPPSPRRDFSFCPHIYSPGEIRLLLAMTQRSQQKSRTIDASTLRALLLTLYATGALVSEVLDLRRMDLDLNRGYVTFRGREAKRRRCIPLNRQLRGQLIAFVESRLGLDAPGALIFRARSGGPINRFNLNERFRHLRRMAGVRRRDGTESRMQDFRATFAVHRLSAWIGRGTDLSRMLPSLSAYMGYSGLAAAEKYLCLTPERFRKELFKLSPQTECGHWRDNSELMAFLARL
jgi:integrase/recombinase XerD